MSNFNQFFTPTECEELFDKRGDFDGHAWYWAIVTPETKLVAKDSKIEAVLTTAEAVKNHPKEFADMKVVPAYRKDPDGEKLHPVHQ